MGALTVQECVRPAVAKIKILVAFVQKNVVVFIDADGLAKTRFVAHLAAYALRIGCRRKNESSSGQHSSGSRNNRDCTHALTTLENHSGSNRLAGQGRRKAQQLSGNTEAFAPTGVAIAADFAVEPGSGDR
jgi:hypothetical protein